MEWERVIRLKKYLIVAYKLVNVDQRNIYSEPSLCEILCTCCLYMYICFTGNYTYDVLHVSHAK